MSGKVSKKLEQHPVVYVSYIDALHYCRWAGMHVPTEWQWEKAARGPEGRKFPWGTEAPNVHNKLAQVFAKTTCAVGQYPRVRSPYGCEDMIGNVSEWCHIGTGNDYANTPPPLPRDGPIEAEFDELTAVRGSCFMRRQSKLMHSHHRRRLSQGRRNYWTGFRPAFCHSWRLAD